MADMKIMGKTPVGTAIYPHLLKIDDYQLKTNGKKEYNTKLRLAPSAERDAFIAKVDKVAKDAYDSAIEELMAGDGKAKALAKQFEMYTPYEHAVDDEGDELDDIVVKFKCAAGGTDKAGKDWEKELPVFDSLGQPVKGEERNTMQLWGGSRISVACQFIPYSAKGLKTAGVSLRLQAVQVVEAKGGGDNADAFGFGVVEGGFTADTFEKQVAVDTTEEYEDDIDF